MRKGGKEGREQLHAAEDPQRDAGPDHERGNDRERAQQGRAGGGAPASVTPPVSM